MGGLNTANAFDASGDVVAAGVADGSVTTAKLAADAVTSAKVADNAILTAHIADSDVTAAKIPNDAITRGHMADNAVGTDVIAEGAVTLAKIQDVATATVLGRTASGSGDVSAIQVDESMMNISNAGTNGQFLSKQSGNTGGLTWATPSSGASIPTNGGIGQTSLMRNESNQSTWNNGSSVSGTGIRLTGLDSNGTSLYGTVVSGTWRNTGASLQGSRQTTTGLRVS